jgi:hypothetical protein
VKSDAVKEARRSARAPHHGPPLQGRTSDQRAATGWPRCTRQDYAAMYGPTGPAILVRLGDTSLLRSSRARSCGTMAKECVRSACGKTLRERRRWASDAGHRLVDWRRWGGGRGGSHGVRQRRLVIDCGPPASLKGDSSHQGPARSFGHRQGRQSGEGPHKSWPRRCRASSSDRKHAGPHRRGLIATVARLRRACAHFVRHLTSAHHSAFACGDHHHAGRARSGPALRRRLRRALDHRA